MEKVFFYGPDCLYYIFKAKFTQAQCRLARTDGDPDFVGLFQFFFMARA